MDDRSNLDQLSDGQWHNATDQLAKDIDALPHWGFEIAAPDPSHDASLEPTINIHIDGGINWIVDCQHTRTLSQHILAQHAGRDDEILRMALGLEAAAIALRLHLAQP